VCIVGQHKVSGIILQQACQNSSVLDTGTGAVWLAICMQQSPSWDADSFSAGQQTCHILQNRWFIYTSMFRTARHMSLSWTRSIQSTIRLNFKNRASYPASRISCIQCG